MGVAGRLLRLLPHAIQAALRGRVQYGRYCRRYPIGHDPRRHALPGELIVSLTSYPPRFPTLAYTLRSLLRQSVRPDRIVLWIADQDMARLPRAVRKLASETLHIRSVADVRSYKKLVFALEEKPEAFIVTCDDDVFYGPDWLAELVAGHDGQRDLVICHRAHRIRRMPGGGVAAYEDWERDVQDEEAKRPSIDLVPTGVGGVLYPPASLSADVTDQKLYMALAPKADDLWFYWCARRAGTRHRKAGGHFPLLYFASTQDDALWPANQSDNDLPVSNLLARYGDPMISPIA